MKIRVKRTRYCRIYDHRKPTRTVMAPNISSAKDAVKISSSSSSFWPPNASGRYIFRIQGYDIKIGLFRDSQEYRNNFLFPPPHHQWSVKFAGMGAINTIL